MDGRPGTRQVLIGGAVVTVLAFFLLLTMRNRPPPALPPLEPPPDSLWSVTPEVRYSETLTRRGRFVVASPTQDWQGRPSRMGGVDLDRQPRVQSAVDVRATVDYVRRKVSLEFGRAVDVGDSAFAYGECRERLDAERDRLAPAALDVPTSYYCVETDHRRVALLRISALRVDLTEWESENIKSHIYDVSIDYETTVWNRPGEVVRP